MRNRLAAIAALLCFVSLPAKAGAQQTVALADASQLLVAAGMSVNGGKVLNPCQHATAPEVKFIDLNGDRQPEAVTLDKDAACYGPDPGLQSKILVRDASGHWQAIVVMLGVFQPLATQSKGWMDFTNASGNCHPVYSYNGRMYVITGCGIVPQPWQAPQVPDAAIPVPATPGADDNLRLFPATYGRFAPKGDCTRRPLVSVSAEAIGVETASGIGSFTKPGLSTNYNGPQDDSITYLLHGDGEGLAVSIDPEGKTLASEGGEDLSAPEKSLDDIASNAPLLRCKP